MTMLRMHETFPHGEREVMLGRGHCMECLTKVRTCRVCSWGGEQFGGQQVRGGVISRDKVLGMRMNFWVLIGSTSQCLPMVSLTGNQSRPD